MSKEIIKITIDKLQPGMVIAKEIINNGVVLVSSGVTVTQNIISKLTRNFILNNIFVYEEKTQEKVQGKTQENIQNKNTSRTIEEVEENFNDISFSVEGVFKDMEKVGACAIGEVRAFSERIQNEMSSADAVIKNIVLNGSGTDTIYRHSVNVAALTSILGKWVGMDSKELNLLTYSAILHDIGKIKVGEELLMKKEPLTDDEFKIIMNHPIEGYNLVKKVPYLDSSVSYGVLMHHERLDGSGYPLKVKQDKIHKFAKIIAIADVFDAVNSNRNHKKKRGPFEALEVIQRESLGRLDYEYSKIFLEHIVNYYMGENVLLNNNKICKIVQVNPNDLSKPLLFDDNEFIDLRNHDDLEIINLAL
jgi:putative nucleotidyltransferase with HDIG domain